MTAADATVFAGRDDGPAPEREVVRDLVRRALPVAPVLVALAALGWGVDGALSSAFAVVLVLANLVAAAALLSWSARVSYGLLMGTALFGYLVRLGVVCGTVLLVAEASWVERVPLGITLVLTHLGLLAWEVRYVSASLAHPGLAPDTKEPASR